MITMMRLVAALTVFTTTTLLLQSNNVESYNVLIIGGTRFSGASLWKELQSRGHLVTLFNRGKTAPKPLPRETPEEFQKRVDSTLFLKGDRQNVDQLTELINPTLYDYVYDMNAREVSDTRPLAQLFASTQKDSPRLQQYVFMSSAGVYLKSDELPHLERDAVDPKSRHKGKLDSEQCLAELQELVPWCSFRPTYICGPQNYNPVERYFFERIDANRPICIPGHGQHLTGLGHVQDLAVAMANVIDRTHITTGKVYNVQNTQAITFDGVARAAAKVMGKPNVEIVHYNPKDYTFPEGAKAFPMRPQHFFTGIHQAMIDLDWTPQYDTAEAILQDSYQNDFVLFKEAGKLKNDFVCDDIILAKQKKETAAVA